MTGKAVFIHSFARGSAIAWLLVVAGIAGSMISSGCGDTTSTPVATDTPVAGDTSAVAIQIKPSATAVPPGKEIGITVTATSKEGTPASDGTLVSLSSDALGTVIPTSAPTQNGKVQATFKAGSTTGTAKIKATVGGASHSVTVLIDAKAADTGDEIPVSEIIWLNASPANFKINATLTNMRVNNPLLCWDWTHGKWPAIPKSYTVIGNHWVIGKVDGQWYGATWEWLRSSTTCATLQADRTQPPFIQTKVSPLKSWRPKVGEEIGFMVSTICRGGIQPSNSPRERSRIIKTTWQ